MHLTTTGAKHMTVVIRTALTMFCHSGTGNTNLSSTDSHSTSAGSICARDRLANRHFGMCCMVSSICKGICSHRTHSTTAIYIMHHMTTIYQHSSITTYDTGIEVEVSLTICSCIGIRTATRTIDITTVREAGT